MREERSVYSVIDQQSKLIGTKSEIEKFEMLENLYNSTRDYFDWIDFFDKYSNLSCIKIAIENTGKSYDEDVEVILEYVGQIEPLESLFLSHQNRYSLSQANRYC